MTGLKSVLLFVAQSIVVGLAVAFAILLIAANTMMMAFRERVNEFGAMKTLGFSDGTGKDLPGLLLLQAGDAAETTHTAVRLAGPSPRPGGVAFRVPGGEGAAMNSGLWEDRNRGRSF